jgi:carboxylesterase type B
LVQQPGIKSGDPNEASLPAWPEYGLEKRATMILDFQPEVEYLPKDDIGAARQRFLG